MRYTNISIKALLATGPYEHSLNFRDSRMLTNFLGKSINYVNIFIKRKKYIITDKSKKHYVIASYNGKRVNVDKEIQNFYHTHVWKDGVVHTIKPLPMPTKEQTQKNKIRHVKVGKLLSLIQVKYGGVFEAEGTQEFSELQDLLNVGSDD